MTVTLETYFRKPWTEQERRQLMLAYRSGASLKTMSDLFGRSTTAINKALTRFGARPIGSQPRGVRPKTKSRPITLKAVKERIEEFEASQDYLEEDKEDVLFSPEAVRAYEVLQDDDYCQRKEKQLSKWITKQDLINYLKESKLPITVNKIGSDERYDLPRNKFLSLSDLLVFVNKARIEDDKTPFFLEEVTEG